MSGLTLRLYRPGDFPALAAAAAGTAWAHLTPAERARTRPEDVARNACSMLQAALAAPGALCVVAEDPAGRIAAYELLALRRDEVSGLTEALKVDGWVAEAHRGQGLNRILHQAGEEYCRRIGVDRMVCVVAAHNEPSLRATSKCGFATERLIRAKWLDGPAG